MVETDLASRNYIQQLCFPKVFSRTDILGNLRSLEGFLEDSGKVNSIFWSAFMQAPFSISMTGLVFWMEHGENRILSSLNVERHLEILRNS